MSTIHNDLWIIISLPRMRPFTTFDVVALEKDCQIFVYVKKVVPLQCKTKKYFSI